MAQAQLLQDLMVDNEGTEYLFKEGFLEYMAGCSPASLRSTYGFVLGSWATNRKHVVEVPPSSVKQTWLTQLATHEATHEPAQPTLEIAETVHVPEEATHDPAA